jgi:CRP/FNR family cyclic AMP-dependent transcriptional regulator
MSVNTYQLLANVGLPTARAIRLLPSVKTQAYDVDQIIWSKGDSQQPFTYILRGLVCVSRPCKEGGLNPINIFSAGTWFGEAGFLNNQAAGFDYICLSPTRVLSIPFVEVLDAFEQDSDFARYIARLINWRDQQHSEMLMLMRVGSPALRVVMGLAMLADAVLNNSSHLPKNANEGSLEIPLKQSLLASLCGVSRGIFSVCIQQLVADGWLRVNYGTLVFQSIETWKKFSCSHRLNVQNLTKPSMQELLELMQIAAMNDRQASAIQNQQTNSVLGTI